VREDADSRDIVNTTRAVASGCDVLPASLMQLLLSRAERPAAEGVGASSELDAMTPREREVIELIAGAEGLTLTI